ncbi:MAG: SMC-Scp complex subunit ScpB, partial [Candidatus Thorarchaeota archaeon]
EILVNELAFDYLERTTSLIIAQIGDRYQMQIRPEYTEKVSKFAKGGAIAERYLRTLTIIALKQPILKSMVIKLRGTGAYEHVKYLLDNEFINAVKKGRSHELTTTDKYAEMFGLPKDIRLLKQAMITQLGIEEGGQMGPPAEIKELEQSEPMSESEEGEQNATPTEIEEIDQVDLEDKNEEE